MRALGIRYQLRLTTLVPVLMVALLFSLFYNWQFSKDLEQYLKRLGHAYITQLMPAAELAMRRHDHRTLQGLINASTVNPDVTALAFYDAKGQLVAYRGGRHTMREPFQPPKKITEYITSRPLSTNTISFTAPITIPTFNLYSKETLTMIPTLKREPDDILGWVSIDINTQSLTVKRYQMYILTIFITLIGLLLGLAIHYVLSRRIYLPILRLRRAMKQISSNEFHVYIPVASPGEIGEIERGCAHLQRQYLNTLRELNHQIETATTDLQQSLIQLEEKNIELSLEKKKMEEKNREKSEFIANISHEIRTPMNGVIGFTNILLESKLDPLQLDYVKTIKTSAENLLTIINDILDYSKMDAGKLSFDCIPVNLRTCVDEVLALSAPNANKKRIDLIPSTDLNVPKLLLGDPIRIKQILTNLVANAIKFTEKGHVLVQTRIEEEKETHYLVNFTVQDTGIGISEEDQTKLFHAFIQADLSIARRFGGTGLGLVICKKLAEAMQGKIHLKSELKKGSIFSVMIRMEKLAAYETEKHHPPRFAGLKAICFDNNPLQLEAVCNGAGYWGISCIPADSQENLIRVFEENKNADLAFLSVEEGTEEKISTLIKEYQIPTIIISKWLIHHPEQLGASGFLFKPLSIQKLHDMIDVILNPRTSISPIDVPFGLHELRRRFERIHANILIAEDNPVNRMLMESMLKERATLFMVENGEEAVTFAKSQPYHLILLDLQMPKLNGLEAASEIRKNSTLNHTTPIVVISASANHHDEEAIKNSDVSLWLRKPITEEELLHHLLSLLEKKSSSLDMPVIDWTHCVQRVSGNSVLALDFLSRFVTELHENRKEFERFLIDKNKEGLQNLVHRLYGASCFTGVPRLQTLLQQLETNPGKRETKTLLKSLLIAIDEVIEVFQKNYENRTVESVNAEAFSK